jgi:hypothetical protein
MHRDYRFKDKDEGRRFFTQLSGLLKNLNYAPWGSPEYATYRAQIDELVKTLGRPPAAGPEGEGDRQGPAAAAAAAG